MVEPALVADDTREFLDDVRIAEVFLLCRHRQQQVVPDQPCDQLRVIFRQSVLEAECLASTAPSFE